MKSAIKILLGAAICVGVAVGVVYLLVSADLNSMGRPAVKPDAGIPESAPLAAAAPTKPSGVFLDNELLEDGGVSFAQQFTGVVRDPRSLHQLKDAILVRGSLGLEVMKAELDQLHLSANSPPDRVLYAAKLERSIGLLQMYEGQLKQAASTFARAYSRAGSARMNWKDRCDLLALQGIVAFRQGEIDNCLACLGPSSCIFPISPEAAHRQREGSQTAIRFFTAYLDELPGDLRVRWLLNLAYMTLGEYPEKVPAKYLIPLDTFESGVDARQFTNVAMTAGLTSRGPNLAGGSVFDDFTGDGLPDLFSTSLDATRGASFFVNQGDGTFVDRSSEAGLDDQVYALNVVRADYDNDGDLDVLLLRGGWERPMRMSLLSNRGDGTFEDKTVAAGIALPISSESASWGDFDNDGWVDLYVCGEYRPLGVNLATFQPDPRNHGRLYRNKGDGTFEDVAERAGVQCDQYGKGCAWGDYDDDGRLDLFVSNMNGPCRLYHNEGDGTFRDEASALGVVADRGFACWFWDYDNDGRLDLFVNGQQSSLAEEVGLASSAISLRENHPRLLRNMGSEGFRNVTAEVGLENAGTPMGCNFGDFDNDGFLDVYLGTGGMSYSHLTPNMFLKNMAGEAFEDVTMATRTGHLQKGHGVSFADYDRDGDLDLFCEAGGAVPGDASHNILFQNPGNANSWLSVKLVGSKTNRAALGAKLQATVAGQNGSTRSLYRTIGNNSSFGGNSLAVHLGLGRSDTVKELKIRWPSGGETQVFHEIPGGQEILITEGADGYSVRSQQVDASSKTE